MEKVRVIATSLLALALCLNLSACSDDENEPEKDYDSGFVDPSTVFPEARPKYVEGAAMTYNSEGLLTKISTDGGTEVTFEYHNVTRTVNPQRFVRMNVVYGYENETYIFDMELNEQGFVSYCEETEPDGNLETWDFGYTADGHLNYMKRSEGGNEVTNITYANGNIVKASMVSEEEPNRVSVYTLFYTSDEVTEPVENKGSIMLFDELFNIDMDEMKYAYYAGLLGKATKNLPVRNTTNVTDDVDGNEEYTDEFYWTLNQDGLPEQVSLVQYWGEDETITFQW